MLEKMGWSVTYITSALALARRGLDKVDLSLTFGNVNIGIETLYHQ
jgi:hypothetical protein